jgi:hypothetical protein
LDLYSDNSDDDEDVPLVHQVRAQQQCFDTRSLAAKESDLFFDLREKQGKTYRKDKNFNAMEFFDEHKEALYLHRLLDTRTRSAKVDEASCERDFSLSGRVFGPLRESMATGVGEQMVSIPLLAMATPVTVDQILRQYIANNAKAKLAKAAKAAAAATDAVSSSSDSDSDSDSHSDSDSSKSGYDSKESPTETQRRLARGPHRGHSGPLKPTSSDDSDGSDGKGKGKGNGTSSKSAGGNGKGKGKGNGSKLDFDLIDVDEDDNDDDDEEELAENRRDDNGRKRGGGDYEV